MAQFVRIPNGNGSHIVNIEQVAFIDADYRNGTEGSVWYFSIGAEDSWIRCDWTLDEVASLLAARTPKKKETTEAYQSPLRDAPWCG